MNENDGCAGILDYYSLGNSMEYGQITSIKDDGSYIMNNFNRQISSIENAVNKNELELKISVESLSNEINILKEEIQKLKKINSSVSTSLYTLLGEIQKKDFYEKIK